MKKVALKKADDDDGDYDTKLTGLHIKRKQNTGSQLDNTMIELLSKVKYKTVIGNKYWTSLKC